MSMIFRNTWGAANSGVDQQRQDMFRVSVALPRQLQADSGTNVWDKEIGWAIEEFPFPDRDVETLAIKHGQQVNHQIGADVASSPVDMVVRYAFNARTAAILERWKWLISNPRTGGVARSSAVKTNGFFFWLVPNDDVLGNEGASERDAYRILKAYELHGCWLKNLSPSPADHKGSAGVTLKFTMQIDRYFPVRPEDLKAGSIPTFNLT